VDKPQRFLLLSENNAVFRLTAGKGRIFYMGEDSQNPRLLTLFLMKIPVDLAQKWGICAKKGRKSAR
jgi:hypothetical protein